MSKKLNSLDLEVKRMMLDSPSIFPSRLECLEHLFCVNGNGYEWHEGKLVDVCNESKPMPTKIRQEEPYDFYVNEDGTLEESEQVRMDYENTVRAFTEKNIDYLCQDIHHTNCRMKYCDVYPMSWDYCKMGKAANNPLDIDQEWRDGIQEFISWYLPEVNGKFGCYHDPERTSKNPDTSRLDKATLNNYTICREVQSKLRTDGETIHRKLMAKHLAKMNDELLKELAEEEKE